MDGTNFITSAMSGMLLLESLTMKQAPFLLTGHFDEDLKSVFYFQIFRKIPEDATELNDQQVLFLVDNLKDRVRKTIQQMIDKAFQTDVLTTQSSLLHKTSALGTTAEIAAKYNISKSEVRRRRANGTLDSLATN